MSIYKTLQRLALCACVALPAIGIVTGSMVSAEEATRVPVTVAGGQVDYKLPYLWSRSIFVNQLSPVPNSNAAIIEVLPVPTPAVVAAPRPASVDVIGVVKKGKLTPEDIQVEIIGNGIDRTRTDENGRFVFRSLPAGQYIIRAEGPVQNYTRTAARSVELNANVVVVELELQ